MFTSREIRTRACELHDAMGCAAFATLLARGRAEAEGPRQAQQLFDCACAAGLSATCSSRR